MSTNIDHTAGIIENVFNPGLMEDWQKYFQKWTMTGDHILNCYGIDNQNPEAEQWFQDNIFSTVKKVLKHNGMESIFGMYAESVNPYIIHSDEYHVKKNNKDGAPFISWLIPYKVDGEMNDLSMASTIIFNEDYLDKNKNEIDNDISAKYFTHCDSEVINKLSIYKILHWKPGSLIYWDQKKLHCSGSFNGFKTKEMFVGHTFIPN